MTSMPCVILCGGKSSRMGENKALLPFGGYPTMVEFLEKKYRDMGFANVYFASKQELCVKNTILESSKEFSPMFGILSSLENLDSQRVFFCSVDTPFITKPTIKSLISQNNQLTYAKTAIRSHYLVGVYSRQTIDILKECIHKRDFKLSIFVNLCGGVGVEFENEDEFMNLNYKQDYLQALS